MTWWSGPSEMLGGKIILSPCLIPRWDLSVVFLGLQGVPFDPLESVEISALSLKMALCAPFHQEGYGPSGVLCQWNVRLTLTWTWDPCRATCPLPLLRTKWQACKRCLGMRQTQPCRYCVQYAPCMCSWTAHKSFRSYKQLFVCFGGQQKETCIPSPRRVVPLRSLCTPHEKCCCIMGSSKRCPSYRHL